MSTDERALQNILSKKLMESPIPAGFVDLSGSGERLYLRASAIMALEPRENQTLAWVGGTGDTPFLIHAPIDVVLRVLSSS